MDWSLAIEKNREALRRILVMLVAMVSVPVLPGRSEPAHSRPATLPRHLHRFVLRLLRPAEAATRRLIIVAARGLVTEPSPLRIARPKPQPKLVLVQNGLGQLVPAPQWPKMPRAHVRTPTHTLSLSLFDPLKRRSARRRVKPRDVPRIRSFDDARIPFFHRPRQPDPPTPSPDDPLDAGRLHRRLEAIGRVLDDLPRQAKRLARWRARRDLGQGTQEGSRDIAGTQRTHRIQRVSPMRPGRPPGWRRKPTHAVDEMLNDLHGLAFWALEPPAPS
jgi:hypothetical protein